MADRYSLEVTHMLYCQPAKFTILGINVHLPVLWLLRLWGPTWFVRHLSNLFLGRRCFSALFSQQSGRAESLFTD